MPKERSASTSEHSCRRDGPWTIRALPQECPSRVKQREWLIWAGRRAQKWAYGLHTPPTSIPTSYFCRARGFQVPPPSPSHLRRARSLGHRAPASLRTPPFARRAAATLGLGLKASSVVGLEGAQWQQRGQRPLAQLCRASAATRPRPAAAASKAAPGTTAERAFSRCLP